MRCIGKSYAVAIRIYVYIYHACYFIFIMYVNDSNEFGPRTWQTNA